jgi:hypothetical protein
MSDAIEEIAELRARLAERDAELALTRVELTGAKLQIEQYKAQLAKLRRLRFGRSSEKLDAQIQQFELMLEDLQESEAARAAPPIRPTVPSGSGASRFAVPCRIICRARRSSMRRARFAPAAAARTSRSWARMSPRSWRRSRPGSR